MKTQDISEQEHNILWKVSLSNGETIHESIGLYKKIEGDLSPWNKLLKYCDENDLVITSLSLWSRKGKTYNLPSSGKQPRFRFFIEAEKPVAYKMFRAYSSDSYGDYEHYTVAEAEYTDGKKLQIWVDEKNTNNSWVLVRDGEGKCLAKS
jgi:hypothetical protein